jgi:hypothetical protein
MLELQDTSGRLIVILPLRFRYSGKSYAVFVDGKSVAEYQSFRAAMAHAKTLAKSGVEETQVSPRDDDVES